MVMVNVSESGVGSESVYAFPVLMKLSIVSAASAVAITLLCQPAIGAEIVCVISRSSSSGSEISREQSMKTLQLMIDKPQLQSLGYLFNFQEGSQTGQVAHLGSIRKGSLFINSKQYVLKVQRNEILTDTYTINRVTGEYTLRTAGESSGLSVDSSGLCKAVPKAKVIF